MTGESTPLAADTSIEDRAIKYPSTLDDVAEWWLPQVMRARFPGCVVERVIPSTVINGTATKARFELQYRSQGGDETPPASLWVKGGFEVHSAAQTNGYINEVRFYRDIAPLLDINRPQSYFATIDPVSGNGIVLLEDLLARQAEFGEVTHATAIDTVFAVLELQAQYHARFWKSSSLNDYRWLSSGGSILSDGIVDLFIGFWNESEKLPRFSAVHGALRDRSRVRNALVRLWENANYRSWCMIHGDAHVGNLYFEPSGRPGYLDWQQIMRGAWAHDVASFVVTALTVEERRRYERELIEHYLECLKRLGIEAPSFAAAWRDYREHIMWPFMWALCPVAYQAEKNCIAVAERACAAITDHETLKALGQ